MAKKYDTVEKVESKVVELLNEQQLEEKHMYIRISEGNTKLQNILNFSIPPVTTCPYKTDLCSINCYAVKDYKMNRRNVAQSHKANLAMTERADFVEQMIATIEKQLSRKKYKGKHITFRIHVSGDFYSYEYLKKWIAITDYFEANGANISFGCYTKSLPFIKSFMKETGRTLDSININFMSSIWADTKPKFVEMTEELGMNIFTAFKGEAPSDYIPCADDVEKGSCGTTCNLCYEKDSQNLLTEKWNSIIAEVFGRKKVAIAIH